MDRIYIFYKEKTRGKDDLANSLNIEVANIQIYDNYE